MESMVIGVVLATGPPMPKLEQLGFEENNVNVVGNFHSLFTSGFVNGYI